VGQIEKAEFHDSAPVCFAIHRPDDDPVAPKALVVEIRTDASVQYGPGVSPDEASRAFWAAVAVLAPTRIPRGA
jgi:hypothetical protein